MMRPKRPIHERGNRKGIIEGAARMFAFANDPKQTVIALEFAYRRAEGKNPGLARIISKLVEKAKTGKLSESDALKAAVAYQRTMK